MNATHLGKTQHFIVEDSGSICNITMARNINKKKQIKKPIIDNTKKCILPSNIGWIIQSKLPIVADFPRIAIHYTIYTLYYTITYNYIHTNDSPFTWHLATTSVHFYTQPNMMRPCLPTRQNTTKLVLQDPFSLEQNN